MPPSASSAGASAASPSGSASASASDPTPSWWESVSQARSRILALSSILPAAVSHDVAALADADYPLPSLLSDFEAVLLAVYSSEAKNRQGKPILVQVPDLSVPSLYHTPASSPSSKSPRRSQPLPIPPPQATPVVGVLSPPLEPQAAVKSTKRAGIIGVAFEAYYSKISQMPAASKVDACNAAAAWAGQYCKCHFELDDKELEEEEGDSLGSISPMPSEAENGKELEDELARMRINGDISGRNCSEDDKEARVPLPWELLQPLMRVLGHCLLAPLRPRSVVPCVEEIGKNYESTPALATNKAISTKTSFTLYAVVVFPFLEDLAFKHGIFLAHKRCLCLASSVPVTDGHGNAAVQARLQFQIAEISRLSKLLAISLEERLLGS
ncbi:unnamed protein product [Miscanthus lutarioriparius]|uniref:Uncharacterized protein n=1 Tax=Miscanthus lutarioriparius TaxID=422564 RepID=A0A811PSM6_9POAL|nr:unnamed protein product [Miscanthus lutarioriparius]